METKLVSPEKDSYCTLFWADDQTKYYTVSEIKSVLFFKHQLFIQCPCLNEHDCILCMQIYIFSITLCQASNGSRVGSRSG